MSSDALALSIQGISKTYRIFTARDRATTLREAIRERARHPLRRAPREDFEALHDVTMEVHKGETVGIVGRNGAGKSTLLKILSRIVGPTTGRIDVYGRLGSLLEVGTGFHPELTGRENIYFNGAILGMKRREITRQFDSIVEFSEVGRFIDTPVKRYSSGMYVRLAFAVASHLNPEILLVDEVLAVGDARFQQKCLGKMDEVAKGEGRTILFVSHNMPMVQSLCPRTVYLEAGRVAYDGATADAIDRYLAGASAGIEHETGVFDLAGIARSGSLSRSPILRRLELRRDGGQLSNLFPMGETLHLAIDVDGLRIPRQFVVVRILTDTGVPVASVSTKQRRLDVYDPEARQDRLVVRIPEPPLAPGRYHVDVSVREQGARRLRAGAAVDQVEHAASFDVVPADVFGVGQAPVSSGRFASGVVFLDSYWELQAGGVVTGATNAGDGTRRLGSLPQG
jgi:lipopolysaccharide transport system ATP-binding protein